MGVFEGDRRRAEQRRRCARRFRLLIGEHLEARTLLTGTASIAGTIWNDLDGDGSRGGSEPGASGITVYLDLNDNNALDAGEPTQPTAANGSYLFQNLDAGNYVVRELAPANHRLTSPQASGQRLFVLKAGLIVELDIVSGSQIRSFAGPSASGPYGLAFDGQTLYFMANGNHTLYKLNPNTGAVLGSTTLPAGNFDASIAARQGKIYMLNRNGNGSVSIFDPATNSITGSLPFQNGVYYGLQDSLGDSAATNELVIAAYHRVDFLDATTAIQNRSFEIYGFDAAGVEAIGNEVFVSHANSNSIQVYNRGGALLRTLNLGFSPGESAGYADLSGANRLALAAGQTAANVNFGDQLALGSIRGTRWRDANGNGVRDNSEPALVGQTMYLDLNDNGARDTGEPTAVTATDGSYVFSNLAAGNYVVRADVMPGYSQTYPANTKDRLFTFSYASSKTIYELNPATGAIIRSFSAPNDGYMAIAFDGKTLYAISETNHNLYKINPDTGAILVSAALPSGTYVGLAYENGMLYSYPIAHRFTIIDPVTMTISGTLTTSSNSETLWSVGQMSGPDQILGLNTDSQVAQYDPTTGLESIGYTVAGTASVINVGGSGSKLYASDSNGHINVYSASGALLQTFSFAPSIHSMTFFPGAGGAQRITLAAAQNATGADFGTNEPVPPVTAPDDYSTSEDTDLVLAAPGLLQNDTDSAGLPPFTAVKDTDPAHGSLTLNANGGFTYHPNANYSGADSFTYHARDSVMSGNVATVTLTVTPVNDRPTLDAIADPAAILEDAGLQTVNLSGITAGPLETQTLSVTATSNNPALIPDPIVSYTSPAATGSLAYQPVADQSGVAVITVTVKDDGGTADGGIDTFTRSFTVNVLSVNDAPSGADGAITVLDHVPYMFSFNEFAFTDAHDLPQNRLLAVKITSMTGGGTLTADGVAVAPGNFVATTSKLVFTPAANDFSSRSPYALLTFQVKDDGGTAHTGADVDPTAHTLTLNLLGTSTAPTGQNNAFTIAEDSSLPFSVGDFGFSDAGDSPPDAFKALKISTLPTAGTLTLSGNAVSAGDFISVSNLGALVYAPASNANGTPYATFTFQVQDDGLTANSGSDLDPTPNTVAISVTPVNDPPVSGDQTRTINEDDTYTFSLSDFPFADPNDATFPNTWRNLIISTLPANAFLTDGGTIINFSPFAVPVSHISGGILKFQPVANKNSTQPGAQIFGFNFQVQDNGGTFTGGSDTSIEYSFTFNVREVNDPPQGAGGASGLVIGTFEDVPIPLNEFTFGFTDANDTPPNLFSAVTIVAPPTKGSLRLNGTTLSGGVSVSASDLNLGRLTFVPATNANGSPYDSFTFQVQDNGGISNGGIDTDPTPRTMSINVQPIPDAPSGANKTITIPEDTTYTFYSNGGTISQPSDSDFGFSDVNDAIPPSSVPPDHLLNIIFNSVTNGAIWDNGSLITLPAMVAVADLVSGNLKFQPAVNKNTFGAFFNATFQLQDSGNPSIPGGLTISTPKVITLVVVPVNDAPSGANVTRAISENQSSSLPTSSYTFANSDFGFNDAGDSATGGGSPVHTGSDNLKGVLITNTATGGQLLDGGVAISGTIGNPAFVPASHVVAGQLRFVPTPHLNSAMPFAPEFSFHFRVQDDGGTAIAVGSGSPNAVSLLSVGIDTEYTDRMATFTVNSVNDPPQGTDVAADLLEDSSYTLQATDFPFSDLSDSPANVFVAVVITSLPVGGVLGLDGTDVHAGQAISPDAIAGGHVTFTPLPDANGNIAFTFQLQDDGGTLLGGSDLDPTPNTFTLHVLAVNDQPRFVKGSDKNATDESGPLGFTAWATGISAGAANESTQTLHFVVENNSNSSLFTAGPAIDASGKLTFTPAPNVSGSTEVTIVLMDNGGTANSGVDASDSQSFTINIVKARVWHNAANRLDVNGDTHVAANDVVEVVNFINAFGSQKVPDDGRTTGPFCDVNGDGSIAPNDALDVVNTINAGQGGEGEGQKSEVGGQRSEGIAVDDLLAMLAADVATQTNGSRVKRA